MAFGQSATDFFQSASLSMYVGSGAGGDYKVRGICGLSWQTYKAIGSDWIEGKRTSTIGLRFSARK